MIALNPVIQPLTVDMFDTVKMWIIAVIDLANNAAISWSLVRDDCDRPMQAHTLNRLVQKSPGRFCIPPGRQTKVNPRAVCIDSAPQIPPFSTDADIGLIHMPLEAGAAQVTFCPSGDLWAELDDLAING